MKKTLFIDSGGFSAWAQGEEINIHAYSDFIKKNKHVLSFYANLDVIGNAEKTWGNQKIIESKGLCPLPVFHYNSDPQWLQKYINEGYSYICLGGMVPISTRDLVKWLDYLFSSFLSDKKGYPLVKVHGFGLTSVKLMRRYPWYSVDSTSWATISRMGAIIVPRRKKEKWIYDENSWTVGVTARSPYSQEKTKHYNNLSPALKHLVDLYLQEKGYAIGKSEFLNVEEGYKLTQGKENWYKKGSVIEKIKKTGISNNHKLRNEINILYFQDLAKTMPKWPWCFTHKSKKGFLQ